MLINKSNKIIDILIKIYYYLIEGGAIMVKCNLSELMGKHKMTIQDVHIATGLNRNTISNLYHEKISRIDFDTIERLCKLFDCDIGKLFKII